jgi:hypothetical protein
VKGTIVVDEIIVPITDIYLDNGVINLVAEVSGPMPAVDTRNYVVNDRRGVTIFRGVGISGLKWRKLGAGERLTVIAPVQIMGREAVGL